MRCCLMVLLLAGMVRGQDADLIVHNGKVEADLPVLALTDEAPKYNRPMSEPPDSAGGASPGMASTSATIEARPPAHAGGSDKLGLSKRNDRIETSRFPGRIDPRHDADNARNGNR